MEFWVGSSQVAVVTSPPYAFTWSAASLGTYPVSARAVNNYGQAAWSDPATVRIVPSVRIAAGSSHALVVTDAGTVWAWGAE